MLYSYPEYAIKANHVFSKLHWKNSGQLPVTKVSATGSIIEINGQQVISFGSSSYLGLHQDQRLLNAGIEAMQHYGILYSSSRSYTYLNLHNEMEDLLQEMFCKPVVATIQTTMAHFSAMQLLMLPEHGAIIDMQAHATLQNMILLPKALGLKVETVLHNDMDMLETKIQRLQETCKKIWYVADGVYSMYGDVAPIPELLQLLNKYDNLYIYFDDAHGMSWNGNNGTGFIWHQLKTGHDRIVLATSLGKGFGLGGGALVCPNQEVKDMMLRAGGSVVFCTQLPVQMLGSGIAAAKIHLTNEIYNLQNKLKSNIDYFTLLAKKYNLPVIDFSHTPIFFIACGNQQFGLTLCERLIKNGFYVNVGIYPAVGPKNTGLRVSLTALHTQEEIRQLVNAILIQMNILMEEYGIRIEDLRKPFAKYKENITNNRRD